MKHLFTSVRHPVKRQSADDYLLITLLSFAASVGGTRLFLEVTGYPQIGGGGLHIAHVLWGGLILFIASLIPLILANRWVYPLVSVLAGIGIGLFIDEVGKFITSTNDYFYPAAAPIIYAFFLLTVMVYTRIRRPPPPDPRVGLYHALDVFEEVLDHDLDAHEKVDLQTRLTAIVSQSDHPEFSELASALLAYLNRSDIHLVDRRPNFWSRIYQRLVSIETRYLTEKRLRALLIGGLGGLALVSILHTLQFATARFTPEIPVASQAATYWFIGRILLEALVSAMLVAATLLLLIGHVRRGISYSYYSLILSLTTVNLLIFYFNQFSTIVTALIQFTLLLLVIYYRKQFLSTGDEK